MKITGISDGSVDVYKALTESSAFQFEDITSTVLEHTPVQPKLLSTLLGASEFSKDYLMSDTFKLDLTYETAALPAGKPYSGMGPDLVKDVPKQHIWSVPSFGIRFNVSPADYILRRKPGTTDMLTEADVIAAMNKKANLAWELHKELAIAQLITADTNIISSGPFSIYNFYTELTGGARAAATAVELDDVNTDSIAIMNTQKKTLKQNLARAGESASTIMCLCGDTFFSQRFEIEQNTSLARELKSMKDFASEAVTSVNIAGWDYDAFKGALDGILYVNYGSEIIAGTNLIADTAGWLIPLGANRFLHEAYAPARTRQYANTQALNMYAWTNIDDRSGVTTMYEQNILYADINPTFIISLINT